MTGNPVLYKDVGRSVRLQKGDHRGIIRCFTTFSPGRRTDGCMWTGRLEARFRTLEADSLVNINNTRMNIGTLSTQGCTSVFYSTQGASSRIKIPMLHYKT